MPDTVIKDTTITVKLSDTDGQFFASQAASYFDKVNAVKVQLDDKNSTAEGYADQAKASADAAKLSADAADSSKTAATRAAETVASYVSQSAENASHAAQSATAAQAAQTDASKSATTASNSATAAAQSASQAKGYSDTLSTRMDQLSSIETQITGNIDKAANSAKAASDSASQAAEGAKASADSAISAANSANSASNSAVQAEAAIVKAQQAAGGTPTNVADSGDGQTLTFSESKEGLDTADYLAAWDGRELRKIAIGNVKTDSKDTDTTYTLTQDETDGHTLTFAGSDGTSKVVTIPDNNTEYTAADHTHAGLMSAEDKSKLDGIADGADKSTKYANASQTAAGLMSAADKKRLDSMADGATNVTNNNQLTNGAGYQTADDVTSAITAAVGQITSFDYEVVDSLPAEGVKGKIYLVADTHSDKNDNYDEYIWIGTGHEKIGNTDMDLTGYVKLEDLNKTLESYVKTDDARLSAASTTAAGLMSAEDKTKLNGIAAGATKNASTSEAITLASSSWSNSTYTIKNAKITATSFQEILPATNITKDQYTAFANGMIVCSAQAAGSLTLKALGTAPTVDIPVIVIYRGNV